MTNIKTQLADTMKANNDWPNSPLCFYTIERYDYDGNSTIPTQCHYADLPDYEYDAGYGGHNGPYILAYTPNYIYFSAEYDGSEWVTSVPRSPFLAATLTSLGAVGG